MYPLNSERAFVTQQWYVAATRAEVGRQILARRILDEPLVFYRTEAGEAVAMAGLCPHRLMPMELGQLQGDELVCGYHGFTFSAAGACVRTPTAEKIPASARLRAYPVVERSPWVWVWMGDPANPDLSLLPDASDIGLGDDATGWRVDVTPTVALKARAQLLIDNLFDLSHLAFVHRNSVQSDGPALVMLPPHIVDEPGDYSVIRTLPAAPVDPQGFVGLIRPDLSGLVQVDLFTRLYNVCLINAAGPWIYRVLPDGSRGPALGKMNFVHAATPETARSTHYFGVLTRDFRIDDDGLSAFTVAQNNRVREEDRVALEAIEKVVEQHGDLRKEVSIAADAGALRVRRKISALLEAEASRDAATQSR